MAGIFICDNSNHDIEMIQCAGLDDATTCGVNTQCIRSSCGRPLFPNIGVSYAGSSNPFDQNTATSTKSFVTLLALIYSLIPYILITFFSFYFLATGNIVTITRLGLMGFVSLVNDAMLKNILKQTRPMGSCLYFHSYGMPSGHAATSIGLLTFMLLELLLYHPNNICAKRHVNPTETHDVEGVEAESSFGTEYNFTWGYGWQKPPDATKSEDLETTILSHDDQVVAGHAERFSSSLSTSNSVLESNSLPSNEALSDPPSSIIILIFRRGYYYFRSKW
eukprot:CAMPEP_0172553704 /NCGR_PEP_ID=MMETSP1067-20121228/51357_1 /TAXON_ID=265564 ORGANISM="Thalassiosira punctigera, Strain Tpunct2005C2" /NCGR_SAMPLE_ID=MMETSP1067 /ASSEMBLY_ACC=CAM_ASM_000444 /LENGTH=277 /DNA_ID=CAMNT_0013341923 /DNA_START=234 /DNA_END=1064 /DNA_ORIENTATION=-